MTPDRPATDVDRSLTDLLLRERLFPMAAHLLLVGMMAWLVWDILPGAVLFPWSGVVIGLVGTRLFFTERARRRRLSPRAVAITVRVTVGALGLAWGVGTAVATPYLPRDIVALLIFALGGLLAGGIATLMGDRWVYPLYAAAILVPVLGGTLLVALDRTEVVTIIFIAVFLAYSIRLHGRAHEMLRDRFQQEEALRAALAEVRTLRGMLRLCANCKRVSIENGGWQSLDSYVRDHTHAEFSHGLCPDCARTWSATA